MDQLAPSHLARRSYNSPSQLLSLHLLSLDALPVSPPNNVLHGRMEGSTPWDDLTCVPNPSGRGRPRPRSHTHAPPAPEPHNPPAPSHPACAERPAGAPGLANIRCCALAPPLPTPHPQALMVWGQGDNLTSSSRSMGTPPVGPGAPSRRTFPPSNRSAPAQHTGGRVPMGTPPEHARRQPGDPPLQLLEVHGPPPGGSRGA
jgi:hypothetical protein